MHLCIIRSFIDTVVDLTSLSSFFIQRGYGVNMGWRMTEQSVNSSNLRFIGV